MNLIRTDMGFSLYNMGFAAGVLGTLDVAMYKPWATCRIRSSSGREGANGFLSTFLGLLFISMAALGYAFDRTAPARLAIILRASGRAPTVGAA